MLNIRAGMGGIASRGEAEQTIVGTNAAAVRHHTSRTSPRTGDGSTRGGVDVASREENSTEKEHRLANEERESRPAC